MAKVSLFTVITVLLFISTFAHASDRPNTRSSCTPYCIGRALQTNGTWNGEYCEYDSLPNHPQCERPERPPRGERYDSAEDEEVSE